MSRKLRYSPFFKDEKLWQAFDKVFIYQEKLRESKAYIGSDLDNLENLFSMMDMDWQTEGANSNKNRHNELTQIRESFFTLVIETLKNSVNVDISNYIQTVHFLAKPQHSSFITLNYDLAIEQALRKKNIGDDLSYIHDYAFTDRLNMEPNQRYVLKLHGSANWIYCEKCSHFISRNDYFLPTDKELKNINFSHIRENCDGRMLVGIIPPTWNKTNYGTELTKVWYKTIEQVSLATHLFIIGYSFPRTDAFFDQLMGLALQKSKNLQKVIIINPSPIIKETVKAFFEPHFLENRVIVSPIKFSEMCTNLGYGFHDITTYEQMKTFLRLLSKN